MRKVKLLILVVLVLCWAGLAIAQVNAGIVDTLTLTSAGTEYSYTFPKFTYAFDIRSRTAGDFKVATVAGQSGTKYFTVKSGEVYSMDQLLTGSTVTDRQAVSLYFQSANAGQVLEISYWKSR